MPIVQLPAVDMLLSDMPLGHRHSAVVTRPCQDKLKARGPSGALETLHLAHEDAEARTPLAVTLFSLMHPQMKGCWGQ